MGIPATGQVVPVPFPFSDLSRSKMRPAVILADVGRDDWILCQVTSNPYGDEKSIQLTNQDFLEGGLRVVSYARPGKLFTANQDLIASTVGSLDSASTNRILQAVIDLLQQNLSE
jgi:mRNA interferase MazF